MRYLLQRYSASRESTLGLWFRVDGAGAPLFQAYTLEDEPRDIKVPGETRIPAGEYELRLRREETPLTQRYRDRYPWFRWHVELADVPGFSHIYVHIGNRDTDTDGCILIGDSANNNQQTAGFIGSSGVAYERWYRELVPHLESGGTARLTIRDESYLI